MFKFSFVSFSTQNDYYNSFLTFLIGDAVCKKVKDWDYNPSMGLGLLVGLQPQYGPWPSCGGTAPVWALAFLWRYSSVFNL
jgi:hypothetical protein